MKYIINHTEARYAVDGKDHFKVMVYKSPSKELRALGISKSLEPVTGISHSTYEEAEKELNSLLKKKIK